VPLFLAVRTIKTLLIEYFASSVKNKQNCANKKALHHIIMLFTVLASIVAIYIAQALIRRLLFPVKQINPAGKRIVVTGAASGVGAALTTVRLLTVIV